jgi:hypothetical protein
MFGRIERVNHPPVNQIPMRSIDGAPASHDTSVTPIQLQRPSVRHLAPPREMAAGDDKRSRLHGRGVASQGEGNLHRAGGKAIAQ